MAKCTGPLFSVWASGSIGRGTLYFKPRRIDVNTFQFAVQKCKGKLTRYAKNKIYGVGGKGEKVAGYWALWRLKQRQWNVLRKCDTMYAEGE